MNPKWPTPIPHDGPEWTENVCPGYYVARPQIAEAAKAASVLKVGGGYAFELYYPRKPAALLDAAIELIGHYQRYEADELRRQAKQR